MVSEEQQRLGRSLPIHLLLALDAVKQLHRASVQDVAERIHTDEGRVRVALEPSWSRDWSNAWGMVADVLYHEFEVL